jgi:hypothetical protein
MIREQPLTLTSFTYTNAATHRTRANVDLKDFEDENGTAAYLATKDREMNLLLTALYFVVELARRLDNFTEPNASLKEEIGKALGSHTTCLSAISNYVGW